VNLLQKCSGIIYFIGVLNSSSSYAAKAKIQNQSRASQKKSSSLNIGQMSRSMMNVKLTWQTIRSLGLGSKMSTAVETFSADGSIVPIGINTWVLKILGSEVSVYVTQSSPSSEAMIFVERDDLLKILGLNVNMGDLYLDSDPQNIHGSSSTIQLVLSKNTSKHLETVYRSPDDDLYLIKVSATLLPQK
jgi:predicted aspartyl protease